MSRGSIVGTVLWLWGLAGLNGACGAKVTNELGVTEQTAGSAGIGGAASVVTGVGGHAFELGGYVSSGGFVTVAPSAGGAMSNNPSPNCGITLAGDAIAKGVACTTADEQVCYKTCGPQSIGFKSETCTGGVYAESSGCSYPLGYDYSCYKIPAVVDPACPVTPPQHGAACAVPACVVCGSTTGGSGYIDTTGAPKAGYCVCAANSATAAQKWSCATATAWPCPASSGC